MKKKQKRKSRGKIKRNVANNKSQQQFSQTQASNQTTFTPKLSPELRQQVDIFVSNAINIIHDPKVSQMIIQKLRSSPDPVQTAAMTTVDIVRRLESAAKNNGVNLNLAVVAQGGNIILNEITILAKAAGIPPLNDEQKYHAYCLAVALYINKAVKDGEITPQELQQWAEDIRKTRQGQKIFAGVQEMARANPDMPTGQQPPTERTSPPEQGPSSASGPGVSVPATPAPGLLQNNGGA